MDTKAIIQNAIQSSAPERGAWVSLVDMYNAVAEVADIARPAIETALKALAAERVVMLNPEANQRALTQEARDWALWYGGEAQHVVRIR